MGNRTQVDHIDTSNWHQYENFQFSESIQILKEVGYSEDLIAVYENIENNIESEQNLQNVLDIFKAEISNLDLSEVEQIGTDTFITTIEYGIYTFSFDGCSWIGCVASTFALVVAAVALTPVGLTGFGFAIAFIGYMIAIAFWNESCGPCFGF